MAANTVIKFPPIDHTHKPDDIVFSDTETYRNTGLANYMRSFLRNTFGEGLDRPAYSGVTVGGKESYAYIYGSGSDHDITFRYSRESIDIYPPTTIKYTSVGSIIERIEALESKVQNL